MIKEFNYKGHHFRVVGIENSTDYIIIRDGRQTMRVCKEIGDTPLNAAYEMVCWLLTNNLITNN